MWSKTAIVLFARSVAGKQVTTRQPIGPKPAMAHHDLDTSTLHQTWDNAIEPRLRIRSGDTVTFQTMDASNGFYDPALGRAVDDAPPFAGHPLTGPVWIEGAEVGDTLEVEVVEILTGDWGYTAFSPGRGLLPDDFDTPHLHRWDLRSDPAEFLPGISIPQEPFLGVMGVGLAESGPHNTAPPRRNGGNVDIKQLTAGVTLWLPILVDGALFSCGDGHAAQGDGEVCITAIETPTTSTLRFTLHKGGAPAELQFRIPGPINARTNAAGWFATTAHGPDLHASSQMAIRYMIEHLVQNHGLRPEDAYILCSVVVDLRISEIVDAPNWIVSAFLPNAIFT